MVNSSFNLCRGSGKCPSTLPGPRFPDTVKFESTHLNVEKLNEMVGEFMQRRVNFLVSALGSVNSTLEEASETMDVDVQMQPYKLEDIKNKIDIAIKAKDEEIWSQQRAITFVGNVDAVLDDILLF